MRLNLKQLGGSSFHEEKTLDFTHSLDLSAIRLWGECPFSAPVQVNGRVLCRSGIYTLAYTALFRMSGTCSRCLAAVQKEVEAAFAHTVLIHAEDENLADGFVLASGGELDLDELVTSDILLQFNGVMLCDQDCRGLCPKCGVNLNEGDCACDDTVQDSRFDVLRGLLEEK